MNATSLTRILSALLLVSAVLHVITAVFGAPEALTLPLIAFGLVYGALGLWVQTGGRLAVIVTVVFTLLGLTLGGMEYLKEPGPVAMLVMFLIDIGVIASGVMFLLKPKTAS
ncbi:MAG: hypothetical protein ABL957_03090 [Parvularculaceae bacterium]